MSENITPINIEDEMKGAYIDYSMSVIISRALPDARDGFKPVHRRVLYAMSDLALYHNRPYKKSARIVGEVLGKYHPHGDTAIYDSMVRMAQEWSLRYPMVDGQGNFGSVDGDNPAAMRYTEARLQRIAEEMLADINKNTVDFRPNFDESLQEPVVLPSRIPNLLVNGSSGIAVGMATNMAPHNLSEIIDGIVAYIDNPEITIAELMVHVKGPDFPTGATIYGMQGVKNALETGRGRIVMRAVTHFETTKTGREMLIATELPYQVNKANMIQKTADLVNERKIDGISAIRDESDRSGTRVVYELKKDAVPSVVLYNLLKQTQLQTSFSVNNIALVKGRPQQLNLKDLIKCYVEHRHEVLIRKTKFDLDQAEKRAHILQGLLKALDHIDEIIKLIRASKDAEIAKVGLIEQFEFSELQAKAILEMRLQRLTGLEREKLQKEYDDLLATISYLNSLLVDEGLRMEVLKGEMIEVKEKYGDARRTNIVHSTDDIDIEDLIAEEDVVITVSHEGYIKRTPLTEYRTQSRGGVGARAASTKEDDFTEHIFVASTHSYLLIFTESGRVYWLKGYNVPEGSKTAKGRPVQNVVNLEKDDKVKAVIAVRNLDDNDFVNNHFLVMATKKGMIKKTSLQAYSRPRQTGINAITINEGDTLLDVRMTGGSDFVVLATSAGQAIRFPEEKVRSMGRTAAGVRGVRLANEDDFVVGMITINDPTTQIMCLSEKGYGKRSEVDAYRITNRGGKGVSTLKITEKTGKLIGITNVEDGDQLMVINKSGVSIRFSVTQLRVMGRATQGVKVIRLAEEDEISSIARIAGGETDETEAREAEEALLLSIENAENAENASDSPEIDSDDQITEEDSE